MCGIVGAIAERNVTPILMEGLRRLEYRGYDSAGLVVQNGRGANDLSMICWKYLLSSGFSGLNIEPAFLNGAPVECSVVSSIPHLSARRLTL